MHRLAARVRRTIWRFDLMPAGSRVVAALSGGADSVALVHLLRQLHDAGEYQLVGIAHLNHQLRGPAADEDEAFCRNAAEQLGVPFDSERVDVAALAGEQRISVENAGHRARYAFFERAAARRGADRVALGHTRDDQAETFLLRLMRGAGPTGLSGMHPRNGVIIRPLLDCGRAELRRFLAEAGIGFREDATNRDVSVPRNRVRHDVLPALQAVAPAIVRVLAREAAIAREDAALLDQLADGAFEEIAVVLDAAEDADPRLRTPDPGLGHSTSGLRTSDFGPQIPRCVRLDRAALAAQPPAIARRVVARAMRVASGARFIGFDHVDAVLRLAASSRGSGRLNHLRGLSAERQGDVVMLGRKTPDREGTNSFRFSLSIPGEVISADGWTMTALRRPLDAATRQLVDASSVPAFTAVLDGALLTSSLTVRNWQPGDRFRPLGLAGTKKVQDVFVDRKVPREARARVPVVFDDTGRVVWLAGHAIAEDFRVTASTFDVVILKLKYWSNGQ